MERIVTTLIPPLMFEFIYRRRSIGDTPTRFNVTQTLNDDEQSKKIAWEGIVESKPTKKLFRKLIKRFVGR